MIIVEKRLKEFGIRKVLGAASGRLVIFFTKDLLILVALANLISWPLSYYIMSRWLQNFAYKTDIQVLVFFLAFALALLVAGCTLAYQTFKAATVNPVETLRYE